MFLTSFKGQEKLKTAICIGKFGIMESFRNEGREKLDTAFNSSE